MSYMEKLMSKLYGKIEIIGSVFATDLNPSGFFFFFFFKFKFWSYLEPVKT